MPQLLGLIFDLDGTLVDSAADLCQAVNGLLADQGRRSLSMAEIKVMIGDGLQTLLQRAFLATGAPLQLEDTEILFQDFLTLYKSQIASTDQLYPGVEETLIAFRHKDIKIGLCTNKLYQPTLKLLDEIGITSLFDFVAGADTFHVYKPHPGHVLGVARALKVPTSHCVMVGDSLNDIRAAQGAGVASIAVTHGYGGPAIASLGAHAIISGFAELPQTLRRLGFEFIN